MERKTSAIVSLLVFALPFSTRQCSFRFTRDRLSWKRRNARSLSQLTRLNLNMVREMKHTDIGDSILYAKCADVHEPLITSVSAITFTSKKTTRFNFTTLTGDKKPLPTQIFFEGKIYIYIYL